MYADKKIEDKQKESSCKNDKIQKQSIQNDENRTGLSYDDVRIHYNANKPAQLQLLTQEQEAVSEMGQLHLPCEYNTEYQNNKVIQRFLIINPVNIGTIALTPQENTKLIEIHNILTLFGANALQVGNNAGQIWNVQINISPQRSTNLAVTTLIPAPAPPTIQITMCHYLLSNFDVPFIIGLLGHELGAHYLSENEMTPNQQIVEAGNNGNNYNINVGTDQYTMTPVPGGHHQSRQQDHINAAKFDAAIANSSPRAILYMDTMIKLGNAMIAGNGNVITGIEPGLRTLLSTYLFDIARIIVDNDKNSAIRIYWNADKIAAVMNWLQGMIAAATIPGAVLPAANIPLPNVVPPALVPNAAIQQADLNWINDPLINIQETKHSVRAMLRNALRNYLF